MHPLLQGLVVFLLIAAVGLIGFFGGRLQASNSPYFNAIMPLGQNTVAIQDASKRNVFVTSTGLTCAEPPPDVMGTLATQLSAKLSGTADIPNAGSGSANVEAAEQLQTAVETLYQRSQGIQALRDMMYRLCEALQNKGLDTFVYKSAMFHILGSLNFVVPFEQCSTLANKGAPIEQVNSCFEHVVEYAGTMLARLTSETESQKDISSLSQDLKAAERELAEYQQAFHYLYINGYAELPANLLPTGYRGRLSADISAVPPRAVVQQTPKGSVPFYPPYSLDLKAEVPPIIANDLRALPTR